MAQDARPLAAGIPRALPPARLWTQVCSWQAALFDGVGSAILLQNRMLQYGYSEVLPPKEDEKEEEERTEEDKKKEETEEDKEKEEEEEEEEEGRRRGSRPQK